MSAYSGSCFPILAPTRTAAPAALITTAEAKTHLHEDSSDYDTYIDALIAAATETLDGWSGYLGRCLMPQTWVASYPFFEATRLRLPLRPVASITSVKYYDPAGAQQTASSVTYRLLNDDLSPYVGLVFPNIWPTALQIGRDDAVSVTFVAGYADAASVPAPIKQAILLMVGSLYANRENSMLAERGGPVELPDGIKRLVSNYRAGPV